MEVLFILFVFEIMFFLLAFGLSGRDIMAPSVMMCAMFIISTFFAIISIPKWNYVEYYSVEAFFILISGIAIFILTEAVVRYCLHKKKHLRNFVTSEYEVNVWPFLKVQTWMLLALLVFNIIIVFWYYKEIIRIVSEYGKDETNAIGSFREIFVSLAVLEDSKIKMTGPILNQLLKVVTASGYITAYIMINNSFSNKKGSLVLVLQLLIIISSQFPIFLNGSRSGLLRFLSTVLIEYYVLWHYRYGWQRNLSWKYVKIGIICLIVGLPIFYLWGKMRAGGKSNKTMIEYIAFYIGGSIQFFNQYIQQPIEKGSFGEETLTDFRNLFYRLGISTQAKSVNLEMRWLNSNTRGNVYTFFRRPLHDFGLIGMFIFTAIVSAFFAWLYYAKVRKSRKTKYTDYWCLVYGYIYFWIVASSMTQLSHTVLSLNSLLIMAAVLIGFRILTRLKIIIRK